MTLAIPASELVSVNPGVIAAGGTALDLSGLILTTSTRVPIGTVQTFSSQAAVAAFFGPLSQEASMAAVYFLGYDNSSVKPAQLLFAQYAWAAAVPAYTRGASVAALTLAQIQAITGTITITVDGVPHTSSSLNLSAATSFSNAATLIQTALAASDAAATGAIAPNVVTAAIAATTMTVSAVTSGVLAAGQSITGSGVTAGTTIIAQLTGTLGGTGTYQVSVSQTVSSTTITASGGGLTVSAVSAGALAVGQTVEGTGVTAGTVITALGTGTGAAGTYAVNISQTASSTALTVGRVLVTYDSVSGAFSIVAGQASAASTIGYATGAGATALSLTQATGAVLSQGSNISTPNAFMSALIQQTQNWASFTTTFEPVSADCLAFATWNNAQNDRYVYVCWDTDVTPTQSNNATTSIGNQIKAANYSGTFCIWEPSDLNHASFEMGAAASINYNATNGRITLAFKSQTGLAVGVTNQQTAANLIANGYNFYGSYDTANDVFNFLQNGQISGPFLWADSYYDQIWLNNQFQLDLMVLLSSVGSIPYNQAGYALIAASLTDTITQALNVGVIRAGVTLSSLQRAEINAAAGGVDIATTIQARGWYLLIQDATPQVRVARTSPPITFFYTDGQSVQQITLASLEVQ